MGNKNTWETTEKKEKLLAREPRLRANINKPFAIDSNILMFSDRDLKDVYSPHNDAFVVKV